VARKAAGAVPLAWAVSATLAWTLFFTLWLPYQEYGNSYRGLVAEMKAHLPAGTYCIANRDLGEPQRAMLEYFGGIVTYPRDSTGHHCRVLLVQAWQRDGAPSVGRRWQLIWSGGRAGDGSERYWLYQRVRHQPARAGNGPEAGAEKRKGQRRARRAASCGPSQNSACSRKP